MSKFTDQKYLRSDQYRDETNLNARLDLHRRFSTNPTEWMTLPQQSRKWYSTLLIRRKRECR